MQFIAAAILIAFSLFMPGVSSVDETARPLISGYNRYDNVMSTGKNGRIIRPAVDGAEAVYHGNLGGMFFVSLDVWRMNTVFQPLKTGAEVMWPKHEGFLDAGFYPQGRENNGIFISATEKALYYGSGSVFDKYDYRFGCKIKVREFVVYKIVKEFSPDGRVMMRLELEF